MKQFSVSLGSRGVSEQRELLRRRREDAVRKAANAFVDSLAAELTLPGQARLSFQSSGPDDADLSLRFVESALRSAVSEKFGEGHEVREEVLRNAHTYAVRLRRVSHEHDEQAQRRIADEPTHPDSVRCRIAEEVLASLRTSTGVSQPEEVMDSGPDGVRVGEDLDEVSGDDGYSVFQDLFMASPRVFLKDCLVPVATSALDVSLPFPEAPQELKQFPRNREFLDRVLSKAVFLRLHRPIDDLDDLRSEAMVRLFVAFLLAVSREGFRAEKILPPARSGPGRGAPPAAAASEEGGRLQRQVREIHRRMGFLRCEAREVFRVLQAALAVSDGDDPEEDSRHPLLDAFLRFLKSKMEEAQW